MNPIGIFLAPRKTIAEAIENPNMVMAFILVLLPPLIGFAALVNYGFSPDQSFFVLSMLSEIAFWILSALVISIIIFLVKRESLKQKFSGILASLSLLKVVGLLMTFLIVSMPLVLPPTLTRSFVQLMKGNLSSEEFVSEFNEVLASNPASINETSLYVMIGFILILFFYGLWLYYEIIVQLLKGSKLKNFLVWLAIVL